MKTLVAVLVLACATAHAADVEPFVEYVHVSDITRGRPFNDKEELTLDYVGAGVTITAGTRRAWEIDLSHGAKAFDGGKREQGTQLSVRFYPGRKR